MDGATLGPPRSERTRLEPIPIPIRSAKFGRRLGMPRLVGGGPGGGLTVGGADGSARGRPDSGTASSACRLSGMLARTLCGLSLSRGTCRYAMRNDWFPILTRVVGGEVVCSLCAAGGEGAATSLAASMAAPSAVTSFVISSSDRSDATAPAALSPRLRRPMSLILSGESP